MVHDLREIRGYDEQTNLKGARFGTPSADNDDTKAIGGTMQDSGMHH